MGDILLLQSLDGSGTIQLNLSAIADLVGGVLLASGLFLLPKVLGIVTSQVLPPKAQIIFKEVFLPFSGWLRLSLLLIAGDIVLLFLQDQSLWLDIAEFAAGLALSINLVLLGFKLAAKFFDEYLLRQAIEGDGKANSELLLLYKYLSNAVLLLVIVFIFAQTHRVNVVGLLASLGIGAG